MCNEARSLWRIVVVILAFGGGFTSCIKYHKTLPTEFPQGDDTQDLRALGQSYVRSTRVYDQFETRAIFDALWMSHDARLAYTDLYCKKRGKTSAESEAFLTRQLEENNHWISVYLLADVREKYNTSLSDKNSPWTFYLETAQGKIELESIKEVELDPEIQAMFGKHFNYFKTAYLLKFPAHGADESSIFANDKSVSLVLESVDKKTVVTWSPHDVKATKKRMKGPRHEDFYWD